jgi:primosomal protein N' (replication factor Y) (superfamily II helicase)
MNRNRFADIILPIAVKGKFTYSIPEKMQGQIVPGIRVRVPFGRKNLYSGIVSSIHNIQPTSFNIKAIVEILDTIPIISEKQLKLWSWLSEYYFCSEGEVMKAALPSDSSLDNYKQRLEVFIKFSKKFSEIELNDILDNLKRAPKQQSLLSEYIRSTAYCKRSEIKSISKLQFITDTHSSSAAINALIDKGIFITESLPVSRITSDEKIREPVKDFSEAQQVVYNSIKSQFLNKDIVLLHGVTSSGKTELYIHLIEEQLDKGKQVLYMLPEIALTTQIIMRLKRHFGNSTGVYHSRFSDSEKVEIWKKVSDNDPETGFRLILGVRSSIFLPFNNLGLIIIDEEHDGSYKQHDPSPRYHARDSAMILASLHGAKTLLGSASPSIESYFNATTGKYGLAVLKERFGLIKLPEIILADTREAYRKKLMTSHFTPQLLNVIDGALEKNEQVVLFQNRRGYSPYIECSECGWVPVCVQCAVNLTYHKSVGKLICHYCGYTSDMPSKCGSCHSTGMITRGFGTEKIEDEIRLVFPSAKIARMDQDTTRNKNSFEKIIKDFEERRIDILIGTQMISKGLDFENLTVVGVLNADNLLHFPDFRAHERSFQLLEQVSGRAGRRQKVGKVIIQTSDTSNKIIRFVLHHDYENMYKLQIEERSLFNYPPFCRIIKIIIKNKDKMMLNHFSEILGRDLKGIFGKRVLGPETPLISQVQMWYINTILIKIEKNKPLSKVKRLISESIDRVENEKGASTLRISVDVDPY